MALSIDEHVPLAPLTTFELGGPARYFAEITDRGAAEEALRWARERDVDVQVLGGGSNVVVADEGVDALVLRMRTHGVTAVREAAGVRLDVEAGEPWDRLVARAVDEDLAGFECLSGIPGCVGATPIQNVGAYGHEISETLRSVLVLDRESLELEKLSAAECELSYRDSLFKRAPRRYVVLAVTYVLAPGGAPAIRYAELERALAGAARPTLADVRRTVLALRRAKSMVVDPRDENRRSAGSFFTNPIVSDAEAERVIALAVREGIVDDPADVPRWPVGDGTTKLAGGWLIERADIPKGYRRGAVGVSSRHALSLVHHGGGTTRELVDLARHVRDAVRARFAVELVPEPVFVGARWPD